MNYLRRRPEVYSPDQRFVINLNAKVVGFADLTYISFLTLLICFNATVLDGHSVNAIEAAPAARALANCFLLNVDRLLKRYRKRKVSMETQEMMLLRCLPPE